MDLQAFSDEDSAPAYFAQITIFLMLSVVIHNSGMNKHRY